MLKYEHQILGIIMVVMMFSLISATNQDAQHIENRLLTIQDFFKIVVDFENIMNKILPTKSDFSDLYYGEAESEREMWIKERYCEEVAKLEYETKPCSDALDKLYGNTKASLYLLNIKNIITDNNNLPVKIYIDPKIRACTNSELEHGGYLDLKSVAVIGNTKFKILIISLPCDAKNKAIDKIDIDRINDKSISQYPLAITKPLSEAKGSCDEKL